MMEEILVDFEGDALEFILQEFAQSGIPTTAITTFSEGAFQFYRMEFRRVLPRPRTTHVAPGVRVPADHEQGYRALIAASESGLDLRPYQSTHVAQIEKNDGMLNDWGIQHFHMGVQPHATANGFVSRTGPIVYAIVGKDDLYVLKIDKHGLWADKDLVEIVHTNWPDVIRRFRAPVTLATTVSRADVKALRKSNLNAFVEVGDGTVYATLGGGSATSGDSLRARMDAINFGRLIRRLESAFLEAVAVPDQGKAMKTTDRTLRTHGLQMRRDASGVGIHLSVIELTSGAEVLRFRQSETSDQG